MSRALKLGRASKTRLQLGAEPHPPHQPSSLDAGNLYGRGVTLGKWLSADEGNSWREHTLSVLEGEAGEQRLAVLRVQPLDQQQTTSPGALLDLRTASPHLRLTDSETQSMELGNLCFHEPSR